MPLVVSGSPNRISYCIYLQVLGVQAHARLEPQDFPQAGCRLCGEPWRLFRASLRGVRGSLSRHSFLSVWPPASRFVRLTQSSPSLWFAVTQSRSSATRLATLRDFPRPTPSSLPHSAPPATLDLEGSLTRRYPPIFRSTSLFISSSATCRSIKLSLLPIILITPILPCISRPSGIPRPSLINESIYRKSTLCPFLSRFRRVSGWGAQMTTMRV